MMTDERDPQSHPADDGMAGDDFAMEDRFNEAHQGIMVLLFAAYKIRGRKLRAAKESLPLTIIQGRRFHWIPANWKCQ